MSDVVFRTESAVEYFRDLVDDALAHQHIAAGELTSFYVVQLLASFLNRRADDDQPLALKLAQAAEESGLRQRHSLREIGDLALFVSGFFADSLNRRLVDVDYYAAIGGYAYSALGRQETDTFSPVFTELGEKFVAYADVLSEVSERTCCATNTDLLRLYERWLKTGSCRSGQTLVERGVVPNTSIPKGPRLQ
jgi:hypothetical protein